MRATLFGDLPLEQWPSEDGPRDAFPWSAFAEARERLADGSVVDATRCWRSVIEQAGLESRHYLQAWHFLREHGERAPDEIAKQLLGVVVEMGLPEGLDLLAVYSDRSARYYNHAGGGVAPRIDGRTARGRCGGRRADRPLGGGEAWTTGSRPRPPLLSHAERAALRRGADRSPRGRSAGRTRAQRCDGGHGGTYRGTRCPTPIPVGRTISDFG
jgi:hypothetical protein